MATGKNVLAKKSLGQHWLVDDQTLNDICNQAQLSKLDTVLEIGPGTGNLTYKLLAKANKVIAVELDESLATILSQKQLPGLEVLNQDILSFDLNNLPEGYKIVANIPYYLTGKLVRQISQALNRPSLVVLLVQKEIAERMTASPGDLSVLGLISQYYWFVAKGPLVTSDKFKPSPKVDSQIVVLKPRPELMLDPQSRDELFSLIRVGFSSKRKTILNNLSTIVGQNKAELRKKLESISLDVSRRPQSFSLEEWLLIFGTIRN